jgi:tRNA-binding EMAP/Myf-like protein
MGNISFKDFQKLDVRIGTVVEAEVPEWSHWVIKLIVKFDEEIGERTVFAGMLGFYKPEDFLNKQFPFVVNMEPKKIGPKGDVSEGMMLAASMKLKKPVEIAGEQTFEKPVFLSPFEKVPNGTKVQ